MLDGLKINFVAIVDNANNMVPALGNRIWHHQNFVNDLLKSKTCIIGRKTYEITQWKGPKSWVLSRDINWRKTGIGTLHSIDDMHLFCEDDSVYILGGKSLYESLEPFVDTLYVYVINNTDGRIPWIDFDMKQWKPVDYTTNSIWSLAKLEKLKQGKTKRKVLG